MARTVSEAFEELLSRLAPLSSYRTSTAKHRESIDISLKKALGVRASWETGSFKHGTGVRNHVDVDLLVSVINARPLSSDTALRWVRDALSVSFPNTTVRVSRPAVVVEFAEGRETWEIIPGFLTGRGNGTFVYEIPGPAAGWIDTAPQAHLDYVNECNAIDGIQGAAKKLSRLVKAWKYYNNVPISSFYLEMRAAEYMGSQTSFIPLWDLCGLLTKLNGNELASMNDPKRATGRFYPCSSDVTKREALSKLSTATTRAQKALAAHRDNSTASAFSYLDLLFGNKFPARLI